MNINQILVVGIPAVIFLVVIGYTYTIYNLLVNLRMNVERQASHIQVHLKKKFDLVPALSETVKGYAKHEKGIFTEVTRL